MKAQAIRESFNHYFRQQGHQKLPSSPLVPENDPSLLFANAGMNQFKSCFTGNEPPLHPRVVTIQKCVRAGGKHNDLENVGLTARHHTFFEMLGNFSFGDYFKRDAIHFAWEWLTKELAIAQDKLAITVHHSDQEAADIWHQQEGVPRERIFKRGDKDNFWEMGEYGPCGPCSEIFYDHGEQYASPSSSPRSNPLDDEGRYVEVWNLVFMQFERTAQGKLPLPKPSIDTGAGLERLATLLQGKYWNYDSDLFTPLIHHLTELSGQSYQGKFASSLRVVADHVRGATMLITDGVMPSHEGRGYVLRRIIRRAVRHLNLLGLKDATLQHLVPTVFESLGPEYPQNKSHQALAKKLLRLEEQKFLETLGSGMKFLEQALAREVREHTLPGQVAFKLYDTYGLPIDLIEVILRERKLKLDTQGLKKMMQEQKARSRKSWKGEDFTASHQKLFTRIREKFCATSFTGYQQLSDPGVLLAKEKTGDLYALVFDQTPFYAESGGQVGDQGNLFQQDLPVASIVDTQKLAPRLHVLYSPDAHALEVGKTYRQVVEEKIRQATMQNHSATHLLQSALIAVLGDHIKQAGSHVNQQRLRFDFTHPTALSGAEITEVEKHVNHNIQSNYAVSSEVMPQKKALAKGALAMFGEKYGKEVRVIAMGAASMELCGGTHVSQLLEIGLFAITSETSLSSGVRRIEAVTGGRAFQWLRSRSFTLQKIEAQLSAGEGQALTKLQALKGQAKELHKQIAQLHSQLQALRSQSLFDHPQSLGNELFKAIEVDKDVDMKELSDQFISRYPNGILLVYGKRKGKLATLLRTRKQHEKLNCCDLLQAGLQKINGRGGGRGDMAQGSGDSGQTKQFVRIMVDLIKGAL